MLDRNFTNPVTHYDVPIDRRPGIVTTVVEKIKDKKVSK